MSISVTKSDYPQIPSELDLQNCQNLKSIYKKFGKIDELLNLSYNCTTYTISSIELVQVHVENYFEDPDWITDEVILLGILGFNSEKVSLQIDYEFFWNFLEYIIEELLSEIDEAKENKEYIVLYDKISFSK